MTAAAEEPAPQDTPLTEAGMPPGDVPEATTGIDPTPPLSIEMPTAEEAGADETPVPVEMQDTGKSRSLPKSTVLILWRRRPHRITSLRRGKRLGFPRGTKER